VVKSYKIPWGAWQEPGFLDVCFPDSWNVNLCKMKGANAPELDDKQIKNSVLNPIGTPNLSELAEGKKNVVIVVDDMSRTTPVSKILPQVLEELETAGVKRENITIILAIGAHRPMNRKDCVLKLGKEAVDTINIENHHPYENLIYLGESKIGTPIDVNATYHKADLKIAIGGVIPHPLPGYGGGAKIVLPGVCGIRTLEANHSAALKGVGVGLGRMTELREDIEEAAEKVGLDFSINVIFNETGKIIGVFSGHFKDAHRKAMEAAKEAYTTEITLDNQICFFNSYPEDIELSQAFKGLNLLMVAPNKLIDRNGIIVIMSSCYEGRGYHSLLGETGAKLYTNWGESLIWKVFVKKKQVYFFSPNISEADLYHYFPKSVKLFRDWNELIEALEKIHEEPPKVSVFPTSIQLP